MHCHIHDLKWVTVWISGDHSFMLQRCVSCHKFAVGFVYTKNEPFQGSTHISIDQVPKDKLRELQVFVSRTSPEKQESGSVRTFVFEAE